MFYYQFIYLFNNKMELIEIIGFAIAGAIVLIAISNVVKRIIYNVHDGLRLSFRTERKTKPPIQKNPTPKKGEQILVDPEYIK